MPVIGEPYEDKLLKEKIAELMYCQHKDADEPRWKNIGHWRRDRYLTFAGQILPEIQEHVKNVELPENRYQKMVGLGTEFQAIGFAEGQQSALKAVLNSLEE